MTFETKRALLEQLPLDDLAYLIQMYLDGYSKADRELKLVELVRETDITHQSRRANG